MDKAAVKMPFEAHRSLRMGLLRSSTASSAPASRKLKVVWPVANQDSREITF